MKTRIKVATALLVCVCGISCAPKRYPDKYPKVTDNRSWKPVQQVFGLPQLPDKPGLAMVLVPEGCFTMGMNSGDFDEKPEHTQCFYTGGPKSNGARSNSGMFWIDKDEITNSRYVDFLNSQGNQNGGTEYNWWDESIVDAYNNSCDYYIYEPPGMGNSPTERSIYFKDGVWKTDCPNRAVTNVRWHGADAYCKWRNARLPTEAEWEYAVSGPSNYATGIYTETIEGVLEIHAHLEGIRDNGSQDDIVWTGAVHMVGSAMEWTRSVYASYPLHLEEDDYKQAPSKCTFDTDRELSWNDTHTEWRTHAKVSRSQSRGC